MEFKVSDGAVCLIDGIKYPAVGFGTYPLKDVTCYNSVVQAGEAGYRIIDTATFYENFIPIGNALKILGRENFYLISKVWPNSHTPEGLHNDLQKAIIQLQTTYIDAYLLHWPNSRIPIKDTLCKMEELRRAKSIRHIGFSNVTTNHLKRALTFNIPISWVQVEMHPFFFDANLLKFCHEHSIGVQAWSPLLRGEVKDDHLLKKIGKKYHKTAAQVSLKWIVQHHCIPLPSSKRREHMIENLDIRDFILSEEEMIEIDHRASMGKRERIMAEDELGFTDEFDFSYEECWPEYADILI